MIAATDSISAEAPGGTEPAAQPLLEQLMAISRETVLEEMASGIAHELNQPLGAIVTFAQAGERLLARPDLSPASALEVFQLISKEALAAAEGIRRMRRLFQRGSLLKVPSAVSDVVRELTPVLQLLATHAGAQLVLELDEGLPDVSIDRLRIQHVIFTLVQNALEAMAPAERGAPATVCIAVHGDRYGVELAVIDSGPGIAAEHRSQMFHPFFTTKSAGTGLGLASARAIVDAHEGSIGFENLQRGARFWFRLPATTQQ